MYVSIDEFSFEFCFCIILLAKCEYDNKTYGINQTFITFDCREKCVCDVFNGNASINCSSLCNTPADPVCIANTQQVEVYQEPVKGTNCSCSAKRCITGLKLFRNNYLQILIHRVVLLKRLDFDLAMLHEMSDTCTNMNYALLETKIFFLFKDRKSFA